MKILTVLGARPQFIKAALLSKELRKKNEEIIVHTGQHYDKEMSQVFFDEMEIFSPDYNLGIGSDSHARQTAHMMIELEKIFLSESPEIVLVYGDTNSTLSAALTASKLNIPIAHVEAGPRMHDKRVPEEINRVITDHISTLLFAPTPISFNNLKKEGLINGAYLTGDVMLDIFNYFTKKIGDENEILQKLELEGKKYFLITVHRARNTDSFENLRAIVDALNTISKSSILVFPLHPRTEKCLHEYELFNILKNNNRIHLIKPLGYIDMNTLIRNAEMIITDSGGLQKESYFARKPCITIDTSTGWPETVQQGENMIFNNVKDNFIDSEKIIEAINNFNPPKIYENVFGYGHASKNIAKILGNYI